MGPIYRALTSHFDSLTLPCSNNSIKNLKRNTIFLYVPHLGGVFGQSCILKALIQVNNLCTDNFSKNKYINIFLNLKSSLMYDIIIQRRTYLNDQNF